MLGTRVGAAVFILVVLLGHAYVLRPRALADTQDKPSSGKKNSTKEGFKKRFNTTHEQKAEKK